MRSKVLVRTLLVVLALAGAEGGGANGSAQDRGGYRAERATELTRLGARFLEAGDRVSAAGYFREAIGIDPGYAPAYVALGDLQLSRGAHRDAQETFRVGIARAGGEPRMWMGLSRALEALGAHDEADAVLAQAEQLFRDDPALLAFRAEHAEQHGRWSLALALTRRLAELAEGRGDGEAAEAARARGRALAVLVGGLDPVRGGGAGGDVVRRALAGR